MSEEVGHISCFFTKTETVLYPASKRFWLGPFYPWFTDHSLLAQLTLKLQLNLVNSSHVPKKYIWASFVGLLWFFLTPLLTVWMLKQILIAQEKTFISFTSKGFLLFFLSSQWQDFMPQAENLKININSSLSPNYGYKSAQCLQCDH